MKKFKFFCRHCLITSIIVLSSIFCERNNNDRTKNVKNVDNQLLNDCMIYIDTIISNTTISIKYCNNEYVVINVSKNGILFSKAIDKSQLPKEVDISNPTAKRPSMFIVKNKNVELFSKIAINEDGLLLLPIFNNDNLFNVLFLKIDEQKGELNWFEDRHWLLEGEPNAESYFFSLIIDFNKKKLATTAFLEHFPTEDIYSVYSFEKNEVVSLGDVHVSNSECRPKVDSDTLDLQKMFLCIGDHVF